MTDSLYLERPTSTSATNLLSRWMHLIPTLHIAVLQYQGSVDVLVRLMRWGALLFRWQPPHEEGMHLVKWWRVSANARVIVMVKCREALLIKLEVPANTATTIRPRF